MPRPAKPPRLFKHKQRGWVILDRGKQVGTGAGLDDAKAERALAEYIGRKWAVESGPATPERLTVGRALELYGSEYGPTLAAPDRLFYALSALAPVFEHLPVSAVNGPVCRRYAASRGVSDGTVRRELGVLSAALKWCAKEGYLTQAPDVWKPENPKPKDRWLTREEVASLLRACRASKRAHLAKFILIAVYTGSRKDTILRARWQPSIDAPWFDLERGVFHRAGRGERVTKKRRAAAPIPRQLLAHLKRWRLRSAYPVDYAGRQVKDIKRAWGEIVSDAGIDHARPHDLKHTAATWLMQRGVRLWDAAGYLSTSPETLERVYGHHSPDYMRGAKEAMERK